MVNKIKRDDLTVNLPPINGSGENIPIHGKTSIVLIGANGVGKTRMSSWIENYYRKSSNNFEAHRISAQKSLKFPEHVQSTDVEAARDLILYGNATDDKFAQENPDIINRRRFKGDPNINPLDDATAVMQFLVSASTDIGLNAYEILANSNRDRVLVDKKQFDGDYLDIVKKIWNKLSRDKTLGFRSGNIFATTKDNDVEKSFELYRLSDGEREMVYLLGEILAVKPGSLIIIDEPEEHLHNALLSHFWNEVEDLRTDCVFLYITHDYDFALSRTNSELIWVHGIHCNPEDDKQIFWDYEMPYRKKISVNSHSNIDVLNALMLEICGSSTNVLLVEGTANSIDRRLYSKLYPNYNVVSAGSCEEVIRAVRGFSDIKQSLQLNIDVVGIVDGDRRSDAEIEDLRNDGVYVLKVAQIENLFLLPRIVSLICKNFPDKNPDEINEKAKVKTIEHLHKSEVLSDMAFKSSKEKFIQNANKIYKESKKISHQNIAPNEDNAFSDKSLNFNDIFENEKKYIEEESRGADFSKVLTLDDNKDLLIFSNVPNAFGWSKNDYIDYVVSITGGESEIGKQLKDAFREYIDLK